MTTRKKSTETAPPKADMPPKADSDDTNSEFPLFYSAPCALSVRRHGAKAIAEKADFKFSKDTNSVPVMAAEFTRAMHDYPIVFSAADPVVPIAVLGLRGTKNAFVSEEGAWRDGTYVPAYVRRYPFILMESPDQLEYTLCIDEAAPHFVDDGQALYEKKEPSKVTKKALDFCSEYQGQHAFTLEFTAMLEKYSLLADNQAEVTLASGEKLSLSGFRMIDEEKFGELPDGVFLDWRKRGWLPLVYCHFLSMGNWQSMADFINRANKTDEVPTDKAS